MEEYKESQWISLHGEQIVHSPTFALEFNELPIAAMVTHRSVQEPQQWEKYTNTIIAYLLLILTTPQATVSRYCSLWSGQLLVI